MPRRVSAVRPVAHAVTPTITASTAANCPANFARMSRLQSFAAYTRMVEPRQCGETWTERRVNPRLMLPVDEVLPQLRSALSQRNAVVLVAPPGAGKTTRVPPGLLDEPWAQRGKIILLSPRRIAARAAAARMASERNERVGDAIGYRVRLDSKVGPRTKIEVVTE